MKVRIFVITFFALNFFFIYNLYSYKKSYENIKDNYYTYKDIYDSIEYTNSLEGDIFPVERIKQFFLKTNKEEVFRKLINTDFLIITMFSTVDCNTCLREEMQQINALSKWIQDNKISASAFGIANTPSIATLLRFKRASRITFPIYLDEDKEIIEYFNLKSTPVTFFISTKSKIIYRAVHPVKGEEILTNHFYYFVKRIMGEEFRGYIANQ